MKPLLIGELNPLSSLSGYALWPAPTNCSGHRLCHYVLSMTEDEYLAAFDRTNLCVGSWKLREARRVADTLTQYIDPRVPFVLLGRKVAAAFRLGDLEPLERAEVAGRTVLAVPHPSGLNRAWNEPGMRTAARKSILQLLEPRATLDDVSSEEQQRLKKGKSK